MSIISFLQDRIPLLQSAEERKRRTLARYVDFRAKFFVYVSIEGPVTVQEVTRVFGVSETWVYAAILDSNARISNCHGLLQWHPPRLSAARPTSAEVQAPSMRQQHLLI